MSKRRLQSRLTLLGISLVVACVMGATTPLAAEADGTKTVEFVISDARITQSSGLATDAINGVYWTMNDVGDPGVVYAVDNNGSTRGVLNYDAEEGDIEAIAFNDGCLYVGDTGGNRTPRNSVVVRRFEAPRSDGSTQAFQSLSFVFPDGDHDTEAMLVAASGRIAFVTKDAVHGGIYLGPEQPSTVSPNPLVRVAQAPQYITDATYLPDGRIILRSYVGLYVLDPSTYRIVAQGPTRGLQQSESVTVPLIGSGLLIGSEGKDSEVLRVPVPSGMEPVATIGASATPTDTSASSRAGTEPEQDQASVSTWPWWPVGLSMLLVVGGASTVWARRRAHRTGDNNELITTARRDSEMKEDQNG